MRLNIFGKQRRCKRDNEVRRSRKNIPLPLDTYNVVKTIARSRRLTMVQAFVLLIEHGTQHLMDEEANNAVNSERMRETRGAVDPIVKDLLRKAAGC